MASRQVASLQILLETGQFEAALAAVRQMTGQTGDAVGESMDGAGQKTGAAAAFIQGAMSGAFQTVTRAAIDAGQRVIEFIKGSVDEASRAEEIGSKYAVVFKGVEEQAGAMVTELRGAFGLSEASAQEFMSTFQDILVPLGMSRDAAAELSGSFSKLAIDLGSFNNVGTEQVIGDIQSAIVGNYETMKKYGVILNDTIMKEEARSRGLINAAGDIDQAGRAQIAYDLIVRSSADAMGDFARTQDSYANQQKVLKETLRSVAVEMGNNLKNAIQPYQEGMINLVSRLGGVETATSRLIQLTTAYKAITDKLITSIGVLNTNEEQQLRLRQATIRAQIIAQATAIQRQINFANNPLFGRDAVQSQIDQLTKQIEKDQKELNEAYFRSLSGQLGGSAEYRQRLEDSINSQRKRLLDLQISMDLFDSSVESSLSAIAQAVVDGTATLSMLKPIFDAETYAKIKQYVKEIKEEQARQPTTTTTVTGVTGRTTPQVEEAREFEVVLARVNVLREAGLRVSAEDLRYLQDTINNETEWARVAADNLTYLSERKDLSEDDKKLQTELTALVEQYGKDLKAFTELYSDINAEIETEQRELDKVLVTTEMIANGQKKIEESISNQKSLLQSFGEAFGNSLGGSLGSINQSFGQIGDASQVMNSGTASAAEMDAATASAAGGWIAIADEVSKIAKQIYDIGTSTGDWGEAFETAILDTLSQIPVIGTWLAEIVDNLWKTGTETLEELQAQEQLLEAAGASTVANNQAQIEILKDQLSKVRDVTKQYEIQADILKLQNDIVNEITDTFQGFASVYESAANFNLDTGNYAAGIAEMTTQFAKLKEEYEYLYNLNQTQGLTHDQWQEYYDVLNQMFAVQGDIEDAKQRQYDDELAILEAEQDYLEASGGDVVDNINAQIAALEAKLAFETDAAEQYDIRTQILELQNELTEDQNDLLDEQIDKIKEIAGVIDVDNYLTQQTISRGLRAAGLSGLELNTALGDIGIKGAAVGDKVSSTQIGTQITNYYVTTTKDSVKIEG